MGLAGWIIAILALLLAVCAGALIVYKRESAQSAPLSGKSAAHTVQRASEAQRTRPGFGNGCSRSERALDERQASDALHRRQERQRRRRSPTSPTTCAPP